ncbi:hypothetical protein TcBrA4_0040990 [Trypanosoma cruzi]|nr:hypothetical protein TcBrA4_0040990 [Trypanosoma cruzi]
MAHASLVMGASSLPSNDGVSSRGRDDNFSVLKLRLHGREKLRLHVRPHLLHHLGDSLVGKRSKLEEELALRGHGVRGVAATDEVRRQR